MNDALIVTNLLFCPAPPEDRESGLLGWMSFTLEGSLRIEGVALRRTLAGRLTLSYPARRDGQGRQRHHVRPVNDAVRRDLERQVFALLELESVS
jgi:DNA-binding cell septation regulator SpoVG